MKEKRPSQLPAIIILSLLLCVAVGAVCYMLGLHSNSLLTVPEASPSVSSFLASPNVNTPIPSEVDETQSFIDEYSYQKVSGTVVFGADATNRNSSLTISASPDSDCYVLVKYKNELVYSTSQTLLDKMLKNPSKQFSFYVCAGESATVSVPTGASSVRYAIGSQWQGPFRRFGNDTQYYSAGDDFDFTSNTYTLTLYSVANGNFTPTHIDSEAFDQ